MGNNKISNKFIKTNICLNCENKLSDEDNFCPNCGQVNNSKRVSFKDLVYDIFGYFFFYDYKLKNSIKLLLFYPGQLSLNFIKGKKANYIHPIRLFFIISLIYFAIGSLNNSVNEDEQTDIITIGETNENSNDSTINFSILFNITDSTTVDSFLINKARNNKISLLKLTLVELKLDSNITANKLFEKYKIENTILNNFTFSKAKEYSEINIDDFFGIIDKQFKMVVFFFLPFFSVFLFLIHFKKDIYYYEHLIFAFNIQTVLFLMLIISELFSFIIPSANAYLSFFANMIVFPIYLFFALKRFYQYNSYSKTVIMFLTINITFFLLSLIFLVIIVIGLFVIY